MSCLVYGVFGGSPESFRPLPSGVGGKPVFVVGQKGLRAALSEASEADWAPDIVRAMDYERVVETFYRSITVIPFRYGCRAADASEVVGLLDERRDEYEALLRQLAGVGEMGIRILPNDSNPEKEVRPPPPVPPPTSGTAYLKARRQSYFCRDQADLDQRKIVDDLCNSLAGLYVRRKAELPQPNSGRPLSIYFLVPREGLEAFRRAACQLCSRPSLKLLVSGPWPPYNFVDRDVIPRN